VKALGLAALVVLAGACKKEEAAERPAPMSAAERQRGEAACTTYVERLCACAAERPALAEQCELQGGRVDTIRLVLEIADDPGVSAGEIFAAQRSARQVIARCIEDLARLDTAGCP
jgi:hypothetical protein